MIQTQAIQGGGHAFHVSFRGELPIDVRAGSAGQGGLENGRSDLVEFRCGAGVECQ